MRDVSSAGQGMSRRLMIVGALGIGVAGLTGCGIRLEDDAPRVPLVPARSPIDAEDALVRLLGALQTGATATVAPPPKISTRVTALHAQQATVLRDALRQRGVPADELPTATPTASGSPSPSGSASPSTSGTPTASPSLSPSATATAPTQAVVENAIVTAGSGVGSADEDLRPTLLATLALSHAALDLSGARTTSTAAPSPDAAWSQPQVLAPLVTAVRTATYFLQVAAARSTKDVRSAWLVDLTTLHSLTTELLEAAGDSAPAPNLGLPLPQPVTTPAQAAALATRALADLLTTFGTQLSTLSTDKDADAAFAVVPRWLGTVAALAHRHGTPLTAFPGLA